MIDQLPTRVRYFERQVLRLEDFVDEQAYHRAMQQRHNLYHHCWGIVTGLVIIPEKDDDGFVILPGYAIDALGREVVVSEAIKLSRQKLDEIKLERLDVRIFYKESPSDPAPAGYTDCDLGRAHTYYRVAESHEWDMVKAEANDVDQRQAAEAPGSRAPIFLGRILREPDANGNGWVYRSDPLARRPYIGIVAERIKNPAIEAGTTSTTQIGYVQLSSEDGEPEFSLVVDEIKPPVKSLADPCQPCDATPALPLLQRTGAPQKVLTIDRFGNSELKGSALVEGDLQLNRGSMRILGDGDGGIHRKTILENEDDSSSPRHQQLRVELAPGADDVEEFVVGWTGEDGKFFEALSVKRSKQSPGDAVVTVNGVLRVKEFINPPDVDTGGSTPQIEDKRVEGAKVAKQVITNKQPPAPVRAKRTRTK